MVGTNLDEADLSGARLSKVSLIYASLGGARLVGADLSGADLRQANLSTHDSFVAVFRSWRRYAIWHSAIVWQATCLVQVARSETSKVRASGNGRVNRLCLTTIWSCFLQKRLRLRPCIVPIKAGKRVV